MAEPKRPTSGNWIARRTDPRVGFAAFEGPGAEWFAENDALRIKAIHDHDALLAAERDAALRREKGGDDAR